MASFDNDEYRQISEAIVDGIYILNRDLIVRYMISRIYSLLQGLRLPDDLIGLIGSFIFRKRVGE
jgi:hypothetical protein